MLYSIEGTNNNKNIFFFFLRNHMLQIVDIGYIDTLFSNTIYVVGF